MAPSTRPSHPRRHYWRNLASFAAASLFAGLIFTQYVGMPFFLSDGYAHPKRMPVCCLTPADRGLAYEDVALTTSDGLTLKGWYLPSHNGAAIIALHGIAANRLMMLDAAALLAAHGYGVLLLDLRAHGDSDGDVLPYGGPEAEDVRAAARYLTARPDVDPGRIGALGFSLGGQIAILGAAETPEIQAVVADGPGATTLEDWPPPQSAADWLYAPFDAVFYPLLRWRTGVARPVSVQAALARLAPRPLLLIGGGAERRMMEHHFAAAGEPKTLWIIPEAGHVQGLYARPDEYEQRLIGFFDRWLPPTAGDEP